MSNKLTYYGNCWMTNLGEAFIDIGAMELLRQALPDDKVMFLTPMSKYYNNQLRLRSGNPTETEENSMKNAAHLGLFMKSDYFVMSGMFATEEYLKYGSEKYWVKDFLEKNSNIKVILMGVGASEYTEEESVAFLSYIKNEMNLCGFISRDDETFKMYEKHISECCTGIDCAFFVSDAYDPRGFSDKDYIVSTFNNIDEPGQIKNLHNEVIRPEHMFYGAIYNKNKKNIFISDAPYDYLSLYANAKEVHTDLVHATIISLAYNVKVKYYHNSKRASCFDAIGAVKDKDGFLSIARETFDAKKNKMIKDVRWLLKKNRV